MIGYLRGVLIWYTDHKLIIDVNGVGYLVEVTDHFKKPEVGERLELYIYTYVRENVLTLYGFKQMEERQLFITLLSVSGIGPKAALNILSSISYEGFINAILTENISVLKKISGIGPKTAQRLILELKNKLAQGFKPKMINNCRDDELYSALQTLGYSIREIEDVLSNIKFKDNTRLEEKIKGALIYLGKGS